MWNSVFEYLVQNIRRIIEKQDTAMRKARYETLMYLFSAYDCLSHFLILKGQIGVK